MNNEVTLLLGDLQAHFSGGSLWLQDSHHDMMSKGQSPMHDDSWKDSSNKLDLRVRYMCNVPEDAKSGVSRLLRIHTITYLQVIMLGLEAPRPNDYGGAINTTSLPT